MAGRLFSQRLFSELFYVTENKNREYDCRQNPRDVKAQFCRKAQALSRIRFGDKVVPAPAVFAAAKKQKYHRAERQKVVADDKVFQIQKAGAASQGLYVRKHVKA